MDDSQIVKASDVIVVPRAKGGEPYVIDMRQILQIEARSHELVAVTRAKAGELLHSFNVAWRDVKQAMAVQTKNLNDAEKRLNEIRAVLLLDKVPGILKSKGVTSSADTREAVIELDDEYRAAKELYSYIRSVIEWLDTKAKFFERSYQSVKKLTEGNPFDVLTPNPHLSGGTDTPSVKTVNLPMVLPAAKEKDEDESPDPYGGYGKYTF